MAIGNRRGLMYPDEWFELEHEWIQIILYDEIEYENSYLYALYYHDPNNEWSSDNAP